MHLWCWVQLRTFLVRKCVWIYFIHHGNNTASTDGHFVERWGMFSGVMLVSYWIVNRINFRVMCHLKKQCTQQKPIYTHFIVSVFISNLNSVLEVRLYVPFLWSVIWLCFTIILLQNRCEKIDQYTLTHWGRMTHICASKRTIIGSYNGLSPSQRQAIIWTNAGILLIVLSGYLKSDLLTCISISIQNGSHQIHFLL